MFRCCCRSKGSVATRLLLCTLSAAVWYQVSCLVPRSTSLLTNTQWKLRLDIGLQPGTSMPQRYPGWAASGARLGLDVVVEFTGTPTSEGERFAGGRAPESDTFQLAVRSESKFVSERGEQTVRFATGGWCVQRPTTGNPEGRLRFWLDCPTGATRRDVELLPGTRIFGTTGVWDDPALLDGPEQAYRTTLAELRALTDQKKAAQQESAGQNMLQKLVAYQRLVQDSQKFDTLRGKKQEYERALPPAGTSVAANGVQIAPTGSLVIKGKDIPDWIPVSEYLILGTFSTTAVDP